MERRAAAGDRSVDGLRGELTRRYRLGTADVNDLPERQTRRSGA